MALNFSDAAPDIMDAALRENKRLGLRSGMSPCTNGCCKMECSLNLLKPG